MSFRRPNLGGQAEACTTNRSNRALALAGLLVLMSVSGGLADDKKEKAPTAPERPRILVTLPLAVAAGTTNHIRIRGSGLTNVTELRFTNENSRADVVLKEGTKAEVPKDADAKKIGDTQLIVDLSFPIDSPAATNFFIVVSPAGRSEAQALIVLRGDSLMAEQEPNGGFRQAQPVAVGKTIEGGIKESGDVDVFRFEGRAGDRVDAHVYAARGGSALDALLTLHDAQGHPLAVNDDAEGGKDARLQASLPAHGTYFLSLTDAQEKGGPTHVYLLSLELSRSQPVK